MWGTRSSCSQPPFRFVATHPEYRSDSHVPPAVVHDLLRAFAIAKTSASHLEALHRDILTTLSASLEASVADEHKAASPEVQAYARMHLARSFPENMF